MSKRSLPCKPAARGYLPHAGKINRLMIDRHNATPLNENERGNLAEGLLDVYIQLSTQIDLELPKDNVISKELDGLEKLLRNLSSYPKFDTPSELNDGQRNQSAKLNAKRHVRRIVEGLHLTDELGDPTDELSDPTDELGDPTDKLVETISIHDWFEKAPKILELVSPVAAKIAKDGYLDRLYRDRPEPTGRKSRESWLKGEALPTLFQTTYPEMAFGGSGPDGDGYQASRKGQQERL